MLVNILRQFSQKEKRLQFLPFTDFFGVNTVTMDDFYQNEVAEHRDARYLSLNFRFMDNRRKLSEIIVNVVNN